MGKSIYLGVFLTSKSKKSLLSLFPPVHSEVHADHMTIQFMPDELTVINTPIGRRVKLQIIAHAQDEKAQAIAVTGVVSKNNHAHVTISVAKEKGGKPFDSNKMLDRAFRSPNEINVPEDLPLLEGVIDTFPRSSTQHLLTEIAQWLKSAIARMSSLFHPERMPSSRTRPKAT